jgi:Putative metal-binding motif
MMRTRLLAALVALLAPLTILAPAHAAVGADSFAVAAPLRLSEPGTVDEISFIGYAIQSGEPIGVCAPSPDTMDRTAWWTFTGAGQPVTLSTAGSTFDTVLAVYDAGESGIPFGRTACSDNSGDGTTSELTFTAARGRPYLVQVGGYLSAYGQIKLTATVPSGATRPSNDDRISATEITGGQLVNGSNAGASQEPDEPLACGTAGYAATVWFKWTAEAIGDATFRASTVADTAVAVYRASDRALLGCKIGPAGVALRVAPGDYLMQVGSAGKDDPSLKTGAFTARIDFALDPDVDGDGELRSTDCNDGNPGVRHGIAEILDDGVDQDCDGDDAKDRDRDRDGEAWPGDCDDNDPSINHSARDIPGNKINEDCTDSPAPYPRIDSTVRTEWLLRPFRLTNLAILRPVAGSTVAVTCKGAGCPRNLPKPVTVKKTAPTRVILTKQLKELRLRQGAVLNVRVTLPGHVGFLRRLTVRKQGKPLIADLCLPVGGGKPEAC